MNYLTKIIKHAGTVTKHRWIVFKLCIKAGIPFRGFLHDLSKYSPTEFFESAKFYVGTYSPIREAKMKQGYSLASLHHKGRNKHHYEYWVDIINGELKGVLMPYKYAVEMVCDNLAAGMVYKGKEWTKEYQLEYWNNIKQKPAIIINPAIREFLDYILSEVSKKGIDDVINKEHLNKTYNEIIEKY